MVNKQVLDELTRDSREYYERSLMKMSLSLVFAALALMFIGFAAQAGGKSSGYGIFATIDGLPSETKDAYEASSSGFGFGCFAYLVAFFVSCAASIYCSPLLTGTANEKKTLSSPTNLEATPVEASPYTGYPDAASKI